MTSNVMGCIVNVIWDTPVDSGDGPITEYVVSVRNINSPIAGFQVIPECGSNIWTNECQLFQDDITYVLGFGDFVNSNQF
jgi:hypothetical protein